MSEMHTFPEEVSEQSEAFLAERQDLLNDEWYMNGLIAHGLPVEIQNAFVAVQELRAVTYDESEEQAEAKQHVEAAIELFYSSYQQSVAFVIEKANGIIATRPGVSRTEQGRVTGIEVEWTDDGEARLVFQTQG